MVLAPLGKSIKDYNYEININKLFRYGIAPRLVEPGQKPRIEVFNPCDDSDDQKTSTAILFDDEGNFIAFGQHAL